TAGILIFDHRQSQALGIAVLRHEAVRSLHDVPAVVFTTRTCRRLKIDLFVSVLPDVGDEEITGGGIEGEAPRVAQPPCPDLLARALFTDEGVVRGDGVRR